MNNTSVNQDEDSHTDHHNAVVRVSSKLFSPKDPLHQLLDEKEFKNSASRQQVQRVGKFLQNTLFQDPEMSERFMKVIRTGLDFASGERVLSGEEIRNMNQYEIEMLGNLSRKKVALFRMKEFLGKYYDDIPETQKMDLLDGGVSREKFIQKKLKEIYRDFANIPEEVLHGIWENYNLSYDVFLFLRAFNADTSYQGDDIYDLCYGTGNFVTPDDIVNIAERLPFLGINTSKIKREGDYVSDTTGRLTGNYIDKKGGNPEISDVPNGFINPNWFLYDIDTDTAVKLWGVEKTKYIFGKYFLSGLEKLKIEGGGDFPEFYNFSLFRIKALEGEDTLESGKKFIDVANHIFEWNIDDDFDQENFSHLVSGLRAVLSDLKSSGVPKMFDHPIQTHFGAKKYSGYFSGSKGFENTHIIDIMPVEKGGKRVLRFATELGQDDLLFAVVQISYFLKHKTPLPAKDIWRHIYGMYNDLSLEGVEKFNPVSMREQYDTLVRKVIWPLSKEYKEQKGKMGKSHNVLLYGLYGTGKSQFLTHLISERTYTLPNGQEIHLEANVINIGLMEFADLLVKSVSGFRKRLSDIHENTGRPIILIIEDIDTIVKEEGMNSDPVSQAMTTLFEGVGSLPITVIASTNHPEILPQRHLRPNRIDTLIGFPYPVDESLIRSVLQVHWEKKGLGERLGSLLPFGEIADAIIPEIKNFTPSHISALCLSIAEELEFRDIAELGREGVQGLIFSEIKKSLVPVSDMNMREQSMKKWRSSLGSNGSGIGFIQK